MQPEPKQAASSAGAEEVTICPNCHVPMPRTMRFCRSCGFRLGEGVEEYAETMRLPNGASAGAAGRLGQADPFSNVKNWGAVAHANVAGAAQAAHASAQVGDWVKRKGRKKRKHWFLWVVLAIVIMSVTGGGLLAPFGLRNKRPIFTSRTTTRSFLGANQLKTTDGGASFDYVTPPGGPLDKAGLLGGDIITSFDGQTVTSGDQLLNLLTQTPIGKTVDVVFLRDGQPKTTKLTTISKDELDRLTEVADNRPGGKGYIGEGTDLDRVLVPGINIYGVRINDITKNRPGYTSGLRDGDIVIEFDHIPTRTRRELESRIERAVPDSTVTVVVIRGSERLEIPVKIGVDD